MLDDPLDEKPSEYVFYVPGHHHGYHLTVLLPYFGTRFCDRIAQAWTQSAVFEGMQTSQNYFKPVRKALLRIGQTGSCSEGAESRILTGFRDSKNWVPTEYDWEQIVSTLSAAILDLKDNSFIESSKPTSRNKKLESFRAGLRWLCLAKMIPADIEPSGRLEDRNHAPSKCLATLSYEAGRLKLSGLSLKEAAKAFAQRNRDMINELKTCLWGEMLDNLRLFNLGIQITEDANVPTLDYVTSALQKSSNVHCRTGQAFETMSIGDEHRLAIAIKVLKHRAAGGSFLCGEEKALRLAASVLSHKNAQMYFEASPESLNAAFHLVLLDVGGNVQPIEDFPFDLYLGRPRRGKQQVRSAKNRSRKTRKKKLDPELYLSTKASADGPSGIEIVEGWKKLTAAMRSESGPTALRLWLWREPGKKRVGTTNVALDDRWKAFLRRHSDNALIGKLPITRQVLRTAIANSRLDEGDFDMRIVRALLGHSADSTTFEYMSEGGVRAILNNLILEFLTGWEAIASLGIDDAAKYLGVSDDDLFQRRQLGFENGLAFAALNDEPQDEPTTTDGKRELLVPSARVFSVTAENLVTLELARRALQAQMERLINLNPGRFLRKWVTWFAIIEGYCQKLQTSGHRVKFRKVCETIDKGLASGSVALPVLW
ncbi:hypothetical protein ELH05_24810 [Rhizobium ruizarguesonis]|uniref:hypothetical protein n=1 Tax=Rhizobium ruizarguesonis TaxID=2081791 RepID=UPI001031E926|nr:hypothetical protein [Rhizobium ruizarguesonis]TBE30830.1 hypothetical protein ELH05_24810 [Rhizobium ruizarguesonis]